MLNACTLSGWVPRRPKMLTHMDWTKYRGFNLFNILRLVTSDAAGWQKITHLNFILHSMEIFQPRRCWLKHLPDSRAIKFVKEKRHEWKGREHREGFQFHIPREDNYISIHVFFKATISHPPFMTKLQKRVPFKRAVNIQEKALKVQV